MSESSPPEQGKAAPARASHLRPVTGDSAPRVLAANHVADLTSSGISPEQIELAGLYSEADQKAISAILGWTWKRGPALVFPFVDYDSRKSLLSRLKPDSPRTRPGKDKPIKYEQAPNTTAVPYIGPRTILEQRFDISSLSIYWTEGEKKTLVLDELGFATFGLTGCHNFNDAIAYRNGDGLVWSKDLAKYAHRFFKGRKHVIVYDSDAFENDQVMLALQRLAGMLLADGAASVRFARIPPDGESKGVGIDDFFAKHGEQATRELLAASELIEVGGEVSPIAPKDPLVKLNELKWVRGAKLAGDLRLPPRYEVRRDRSLWAEPPADKPEGDWREAMRSVLIPAALLQSIEDEGDQRIEIAYFAREEWRRGKVDRLSLRDARKALADMPADVAIDSNNASGVVQWLSEYMRHNEHRLPVRRFVSESGWHEAGGEVCFLADTPIVRAGANHKVKIEADEAGDRGGMIRALAPQGSAEAHRSALRDAFNSDAVAAVAILAALAAPLLKPLRAPNFGVHMSGDSSRGKTTKLAIAASVFGDPKNNQWLASWNTTSTAMELRAQTLCDLPLCFDEIGAGDRLQIEKSIYMLINGSGRERAERTMKLRKTPSWRTVVLSTGEHELASDEANTGAQVRVIQYRVTGFGSLDARGVDDLRERATRNSGQVGREWLRMLVDVDDWSELQALFETAKVQFRGQCEGNQLAQRQAVYFALLAVTEHLASQTIGIGRKGGATVRELFTSAEGRKTVSSAGDRALDAVSQWLASEPDSFPRLDYGAAGGLESRTKSSVRRINGVKHASTVLVLPEALKPYLAALGLSFNEVIAGWQERGVTDCDAGRKLKRMRWDGARVWTVAIKYEALGMSPDAASQVHIEEKLSKDDYGNSNDGV